MSKLINEDCEHASYANDEMYRGHREYIMRMEYEEWEREQEIKNKKPAIITLEKPTNETPHKPKDIQRNNKEEL
jgi:predicted double-glycine peptidase